MTTFLDKVDYRTDAGIGAQANIGLIALSIDQTIEREFAAIATRPGVATYCTRVPCDVQITPDKLVQMRAHIGASVRLLPPTVDLDVIAYGCTSATMVMGEQVVAQEIKRVRPSVRVTDPISAGIAAIKAMGLTRVAVVTPYIRSINEIMCAHMRKRGVEVAVLGAFEESDDSIVARIDQRSVYEAILSVGRSSQCDGVFLSCTSLRALDILEAAERELGVPVTTSNHALAWHALKLSGVSGGGFGRLFDHTLRAA